MVRSARRVRLALALCLLTPVACSSEGAPATPRSGPASAATSALPSTEVASAGSAVRLLDTLAVKGRAPRTGYDRARFGPSWTDDTSSPLGHNGCDTRNDILRRDLRDVALRPGSNGCAVLSGTLRDPYTARTISFVRGPGSADVQIDHVVALSDAWQKGAFRWATATRAAFANDPLNLLAVDGPTNAGKGDGDAATWLPPSRTFRCAYIARQIAVKARYGLWITPAERDASARVLQTCPDHPAPSESPAVRVSLEPTPTPTPTGTGEPASRCTTTRSGSCIRGGQLCPHASYGDVGRDAEARTHRCTGERDHPRWQ